MPPSSLPDMPQDMPPDSAPRFAAMAAVGQIPRGQIEAVVTAARHASDPRVRATALGALVRGAGRRRAREAWRASVRDPDAAVRRRAAELGPALSSPSLGDLEKLLADTDPLVAEATAWALGEIAWPEERRARVVTDLSRAASHDDPLVREAAVAALGALGDPRGLDAVLAACHDRPAIRRRAVLALAPFEGPEVEAALTAALDDVDWQVRQAAEDLAPPNSSA